MKYKLKFEIFDKAKRRDMTIDNILGDISTEFESDKPLSIPSKGESIFIKNKEYDIHYISHILESDTYTTIVNLKSIHNVKKHTSDEGLWHLNKIYPKNDF